MSDGRELRTGLLDEFLKLAAAPAVSIPKLPAASLRVSTRQIGVGTLRTNKAGLSSAPKVNPAVTGVEGMDAGRHLPPPTVRT